jgi:hypothetical protein
VCRRPYLATIQKWTPITTARILPRLINRDAKADIARQRKIIEDLNWSGRETDLAESMLETLEGCLRALEHHREVLMDCLRNAERRSVKL